MSWNGSEQLEKAMEEVLDDDDEVKVEKSSVEKMEKHNDPQTKVQEHRPAGIDFSDPFTVCLSAVLSFTQLNIENWNINYTVLRAYIILPGHKILKAAVSLTVWQHTHYSWTFPEFYWHLTS